VGIEIERKFLLADDSWRARVDDRLSMAQGYLVGAAALASGHANASVRVRIAGAQAWLNIKSVSLGIERQEYEYAIPPADARHMLATLCDGVVEKTRHHVRVDDVLFEIDEFAGANQGLIVAEVELPAIDADFPRPAWLGREVSAEPAYFNVNLIAHPFAHWNDAERRGDSAC
jgi:adenylate cyclase